MMAKYDNQGWYAFNEDQRGAMADYPALRRKMQAESYETQLVQIACALGKDAIDAPDDGQSIAGLVKDELAALRRKLQIAEECLRWYIHYPTVKDALQRMSEVK